jgi:hypothetical protein
MFMRKILALSRIEQLRSELDAPNERQQQFIETLRVWTEKRNAIIGDSGVPDSLSFYECRIKYIENDLPSDLASFVALSGNRPKNSRTNNCNSQ